jgi:hypothetical protein
MPCFCTTPEEDLEDAQKAIKELMRKIVHEMNCTRARGYDPAILLNDTHKLMDHMFYGKCDENWMPTD